MKHLDKQDSELKSEVLMMKSQMVETKKNFELNLQNATTTKKAKLQRGRHTRPSPSTGFRNYGRI
jgi:hypothetical protein